MMTLEQEKTIIELLSNLPPLEYSLLMKKIDRRKWESIPSQNTLANIYYQEKYNTKNKK